MKLRKYEQGSIMEQIKLGTNKVSLNEEQEKDVDLEKKVVVELPLLSAEAIKSMRHHIELAKERTKTVEKASEEMTKEHEEEVKKSKEEANKPLSESYLNENFKDRWTLTEGSYIVKCAGRKDLRQLIAEAKANNICYKFFKLTEGDYKYDFKYSLSNGLEEIKESKECCEEECKDKLVVEPEHEKCEEECVKEECKEEKCEEALEEKDGFDFTHEAFNVLKPLVLKYIEKGMTKEDLEKQVNVVTLQLGEDDSIKWINETVEEKCDKKEMKESFKSEDVVKDLIDRALMIYDEGEHDLDELVSRTIDEGLIYSSDIWAIAEDYVNDSELLELFIDNFIDDLREKVKEALDERNEEVEESLKEAKNSRLNYVYQFPADMTEEDIEKCKEYNLEYLGKVNERGFQPGDHLVKGKLVDLKKYCKEYFDYEMHPDYLYKEDEIDLEDILDESKQEESLKEALDLKGTLKNYKPWGKAKELWSKINDYNKVDDLEYYLSELYPNGLELEELNDLLSHSSDIVETILDLKDLSTEEEVQSEEVAEVEEPKEENSVEDETLIDDETIDRLKKGQDTFVPSEKEPTEQEIIDNREKYLNNATGYDEEDLSDLEDLIDTDKE